MPGPSPRHVSRDGHSDARPTKTHVVVKRGGQFLTFRFDQLRAHLETLAVTTQEETTRVPAAGITPKLDPRPVDRKAGHLIESPPTTQDPEHWTLDLDHLAHVAGQRAQVKAGHQYGEFKPRKRQN